MKTKARTATMLMTLVLALAMGQAYAAPDSRAALMEEAKVSEAQARATVLARIPNGTVKSAELEREHGRLIWSFDVSRPSVKGVTEIQVDALSGKIASEKKETPVQEAKEARAEKNSHK